MMASEPWHESGAIDGLDRVQTALATIAKEQRHGVVIGRAWPGFRSLLTHVQQAQQEIAAARAVAPCKIWGLSSDGGGHCSVHHHTWSGEPTSGDCEKRSAAEADDE